MKKALLYSSVKISASFVVVLAVAICSGCGEGTSSQPAPKNANSPGSQKTLTIYHHGSPTPAIVAAQEAYEKQFPDVKVLREKDDALPNMRKVTDLQKHADIIYTDDYSIIPPVMFPKYANAWIMYAHDEMTIAYAKNSKYANEINANNWMEILARPDVRWGIADPNAGPDGYFSLGQIALSNLHYKNDKIFHDLIEAHTAIRMTNKEGHYTIDCPENLAPNSKNVLIRPDPETLYPMILAGEIDFAFAYKGSVIGEGPAGILTVDLPKEVNLADTSLVKSIYNNVTINVFSDVPSRKITVLLGAKANGLTIPLNAEHPDLAADYLKIFLGPVGQKALNGVHIVPLTPAKTNDLKLVPESLRSLLEQQ